MVGDPGVRRDDKGFVVIPGLTRDLVVRGLDKLDQRWLQNPDETCFLPGRSTSARIRNIRFAGRSASRRMK